MKTIAILGAAGYLGIKLTALLLEKNYAVTAITRQNGSIMFGDKNIKLLQIASLPAQTEKYDVIINLAYATATLKRLINAENQQIISILKQLSHSKTHIIHTSTLAVFGFALDKKIETKPVKNRADYPYIVSKINMENLLLENFKNQPVSILRLGNIWGPASVGWTIKIADNLLYQKPVAAGNFGYSNITDVHNAADYIHFLAAEKTLGVTFHHLAELGHFSWEYWVNALAVAINEQPVINTQRIHYNQSISQDLGALKHFFSPTPFLYGALETRFLSYYLRNFIAGLPRAVKKPFNILAQSNNAGKDFVFLTIMSGKNHFPNSTNPNWQAPVNEYESLKRVLLWMKESGYLVNY